MKVIVLNGNSDPANTVFDEKIDSLKQTLSAGGSEVTVFTLREMNLHYCVGCWGCWVKKPGQCVSADDGPQIMDEFIRSDFVLWAAPLKMGFPEAMLKKIMDKTIPLIHPYMTVDHNEAHHRPRYDRYPRLGLWVQAEADTTPKDMQIVADVFSRTALNIKSKLEFLKTIDTPIDELARAILTPEGPGVPFEKKPAATQGLAMTPPSRITIFNGSPRGKKGNTPLLVKHFLDGFTSIPGRSFESYDLVHTKDAETFRQAFVKAECVLLGLPLYTDSMPAIVKAFIEELELLKGWAGSPPILFLVQSGFPEAVHSRHIERYLAELAARLGCPYLGTIIKGGVEGMQIMPENMTSKTFTAFSRIGRQFAETGRLDPAALHSLAKPESFPAAAGPFFRLFLKLPIANYYWDSQLKENGAYADRFARPYGN